MKTQHIFLLVFTLCVGIFGVSMSNQYFIKPTEGTISNVTFAEDLTIEMQNKAMKIIPLTVPNEDELVAFRRLVSKELANAKKDPSIHFTVDAKRGLVSFNRGMQQYHGAFRPTLPSAKEAASLSMKFLRESKMMPKNADQLKLIHNGGLRAAYLENGKKSVTIDKLRTLTYGRVIDGIPVTGEGSKIVVNVGHKGSIVSVIHKWKSTTGKSRIVSPKEMKSAAAAKEEIQKLIAKEFSGKAQIRKIQQIYYNGNGKFIQPVYAFEAVIRVAGVKKPAPYYGMIPALYKAPEAVDINRKTGARQAQEYIKQTSPKVLPRVGKEKLD